MKRYLWFLLAGVLTGLGVTLIFFFWWSRQKSPSVPNVVIESSFDSLPQAAKPDQAPSERAKPSSNPTSKPQATQAPTLSPSPSIAPTNGASTQAINKKVEELQEQMEKLQEEITDLQASQGKQTIVQEADGTKEYYIYLGSGNTNHRDWTEITSATAQIDKSNYPDFKQAYFEAALSTTGGEVYARLKNNDTGGTFYITEVYHNQQSSAWKTSLPFQLDEGMNEYLVELRSSSGELAKLDGARIRIVVE